MHTVCITQVKMYKENVQQQQQNRSILSKHIYRIKFFIEHCITFVLKIYNLLSNGFGY